MSDVYSKVVNVQVPDPDPESDKRVFEELSKREQWRIFSGEVPTEDNPPIIPPGKDRPVDDAEPPPEEKAVPLPVAEVSMSEYEERREQPKACFKCGTNDNLRPWGHMDTNDITSQVMYLCAGCWEILSP